MRTDDAELVARARTGDRAAYSGLIGRYRDAVFGVAYHHLGRFDDAEDAAQDAFVRAYVRLRQLRDPAKFGPWLRRIITTICMDLLRRRVGEAEPLRGEHAEIASADRDLEQTAARVAVRQALAQLSETSRLTVTLFHINGYSHRDIASFLDVPITTVRTRLQRAKKRLREEMVSMVDNVLKEERPDEQFAERVERRVFSYSATDERRGVLISGTSEAVSAEELAQRLSSRGYRITWVVADRDLPEPQEPLGHRVAGVILAQAVSDSAGSIKIVRDREGLSVHYLIEGTWHTVLQMPAHMWAPLRERLADLAGVRLRYGMSREPGRISHESGGKRNDFTATFGRRTIGIEAKLAPRHGTSRGRSRSVTPRR